MRTHFAYANFDRVLVVLSAGARARARKRACAWTGIYTCSECACVRVCTTTYLIFYGVLPQTEKMSGTSVKNHFNEMKGDVVGMYIFVLELTTYNYFLFLCS